MADLTPYGAAAEAGERAASEAIRRAIEDDEPDYIVAFLITAVRSSGAWQDGAFTMIASAAMGCDSGQESQPDAQKCQSP